MPWPCNTTTHGKDNAGRPPPTTSWCIRPSSISSINDKARKEDRRIRRLPLSDFCATQGIRGRTAVVAPPVSAFVSRLSSSRSSGNSAGILVVCRGLRAPACVSSGSWASCHYPAGGTALPGRQGRPAAVIQTPALS